MARPIEYNKEEVLESAMYLFWERGYEATSMKDIVQVTGLNSRTMYNIFRSKSGLFHVSLKYYYDQVVEDLINSIRDEKGLSAVSHYIKRISDCATTLGCLLVNTDSERNNIELESVTYVDEYFYELERIFREKMTYAYEKGEYADDPTIRARQLILILKGFCLDIKNTKNIEASKLALNNMIQVLNLDNGD